MKGWDSLVYSAGEIGDLSHADRSAMTEHLKDMLGTDGHAKDS